MGELFEVAGKVAVITGGAGVLCSEMARALAKEKLKVAILDFNEEAAQKAAAMIKADGGIAVAVKVNVLEKASLETAKDIVLKEFGRVDILINGAGGNNPKATTSKEQLFNDDLKNKPEGTKSFFDLESEGVQFVFNLNFLGTLLPTQVFGRVMAEAGQGIIINISSMNAFRPLTKIPAYSAAKAAISNFTQWLAMHMAPVNIRVNAIAPGFFLTAQNRFLMTDEKTGELTARGKTVLAHTPMGRFGAPGELIGTLLWLISDASTFVTGIVVPIDGGFSAYSGV
ncbi:MAG TPA: D-mannonate oxidoreductase [Firmicutes bacterium]|jgi:NAD(P)-dependent dehydrogenase (short-subunit alcohol dehydrogenase family)|nr:D-mannonate oxidoreductase [Bacillota bacterium]